MILTRDLEKCFEDNKQSFTDVGIDISDIGTHSSRKGSVMHCITGSTVPLTIVSICLRSGWIMGPMKETYIHYKKTGDQYVSRVVIRLDVNSIELAVSPLYFKFSEVDDPEGGGSGIGLIKHDIKHAILSLTLEGRLMSPQISITNLLLRIYCVSL